MTGESLAGTSAPISWSVRTLVLRCKLRAKRLPIHAGACAGSNSRDTRGWAWSERALGSAVGSITMAHDPAVRAGGFLHVSTYFADAVRTGMSTMHVWEGMRTKVSEDELRRYWTPISPVPYMHRLRDTGQRLLMVSGRYDPTFWYEFTDEMFRNLRDEGIRLETFVLPCGHYSLELAPFALPAALRLGLFLFEALA